jgi:hypothetical protein
VLNQDLDHIAATEDGLDRLIERLRQDRRDLRVTADDFQGWSRGARFYPLLYMLTRVWKARDWGSGLELSRYLLGRMNQIEVHHIFPKALLYRAKDHGYTRPEVNAIANLTFLTKDTNLAVSDRDPAAYLEEVASQQPQALESHWIPMDRQLWRVERYRDFLAARRELLANACNEFLDSLLAGSIPEAETPGTVGADVTSIAPVAPVADDDERQITAINEWVIARGLPAGAALFELAEPETGRALGVLDLAWPDGLQPELSDPVAVMLDDDPALLDATTRAGYRVFVEPATFRAYVEREILARETAEAAD